MGGPFIQATGVERGRGFADVAAYMPARPLDVDLPDLDIPTAAPSKPPQQMAMGADSGSYRAVDFNWDQSSELNVPGLLPDVQSKSPPSQPAPSSPPAAGPS